MSAERRDALPLVRRLLALLAALAVVGTFLGLVLVQRLGDRYRDALTVTAEGAEVAAQSAAAADGLAADLADLAATADEGLEQAKEIVELASASLDDVGTAMGTNVADGVEATASVADGLAGLIEAIERFIPGDRQSVAEDLRVLADGLEPVPEQLRTLGEQLDDASTSLDASVLTLTELQTELDAVMVSIGQAEAALDEVVVSAELLQVRAADALDGSSTDLWLVRLVVVVIGAGVALAAMSARRALGVLAAERDGGPPAPDGGSA